MMRLYIHNTDICTADYMGPDRRRCNERRVTLDPRRIPRFDLKGGDLRSNKTRRIRDEARLRSV